MPASKDEIARRLREAAAARESVDQEKRTTFSRPERFIGDPVGVGDDGQFYRPSPEIARWTVLLESAASTLANRTDHRAFPATVERLHHALRLVKAGLSITRELGEIATELRATRDASTAGAIRDLLLAIEEDKCE